MDASVAMESQPSPTTTSRWLAVGLAVVALAEASVSFSLNTVARQRGTPFSSGLAGELGTWIFVLTVVVLGVMLRWRRPDHQFGWLLLAFGLIVGTSSLFWSWMLVSSAPGGDPELGAVGTWLGGVFALAAFTYVIASMIARFPSGRPDSAREQAILRWAAAGSTLGAVASAIRPGPIAAYPAFDNPLPLPASLAGLLQVVSSVGLALAVVPAIAAGLAMVARYRRASEVERLQLRWFAYATSIAMVASVGYLVFGILLFSDNNAIRELTYAAFVLALCGLPIAVFIAIMRHRLYDIDTIIGRTVAYGVLTAILAGLYSASVRGFNAIFVAITGEESEATLVLTTLILATTFTPIKTSLEKIAAKRFPATPAPALATAAQAPLVTTPGDDLDARIEAIARRVAGEILAEREGAGPGAPPEAR